MQWITTTHVLNELRSSNDGLVWNTFRDHFYPVIVNFAQRLGLSGALAEDAAQETMLAFLKSFRSGNYNREKGKLSSWIFGIARLTILDCRKKAPREKIISEGTDTTSFWDQVVDEKTVEAAWEVEWRKMVLERCLARASKEFGQKIYRAFELYAFEQKPIEEVCHTLDMSRNAVYIAKNRVLSKLRSLQQEFESVN
jgi:RNA polymerase sigma-70 factor (ECF subfamily)